MTNYVVTGLQTTLPYASLDFFDSLLIGTGSGLYVFGEYIGSDTAPPARVKLTVLGDLAADIVFLGGESYIFIGAAGTLVCEGDSGIYLGVSGASIVENRGSISNFDGNAIVMHDDDKVTNSGTISGEIGVRMAPEFGNSNLLYNTGTINGADVAVYMGTSYSHIENAGRIESLYNEAIYVEGDYDYVTNVWGLIPTVQNIHNSGTILSESRPAIRIDLDLAASEFRLTNSGTITSMDDDAILSTRNNKDIIRNSGTINGDVMLGNGDDVFNGRGGEVNGNVDTGAGSDIIDLRGAVMNGAVTGGLGNDTYYVDDSTIVPVEANLANQIDLVFANTSYRLGTGLENLTLLGSGNFNGFGNSDANKVFGNDADNRLYGYSRKDTIFGDMGDDRLFGGLDNDNLYGGYGDDVLFGGSGNDVLSGGDGADTIFGGLGKDTLFGNEGADVFAFADNDCSTLSGGDEVIAFNTLDGDMIDVSRMDANILTKGQNEAFTYIGSGPFTNVAGQLRVSTTGSFFTVSMDLDGDSLADAVISGVNIGPNITASDFVL